MKRVTFLCPAMTTGGPEAIHQVAQLLSEEGLPADIAYYGAGGDLASDRWTPAGHAPAVQPCPHRLRPLPAAVVCRQALLRRHHLSCCRRSSPCRPRPSPARASPCGGCRSTTRDRRARRPRGAAAVLPTATVRHFHQSAYAADFLRSSGVPESTLLGDFTDARFTAVVPSAPARTPPSPTTRPRGRTSPRRSSRRRPAVTAAPIQGMTKDQIVDRLRSTRVYVDFGNLPGKDRLPREAAASGAVVFVRRARRRPLRRGLPGPGLLPLRRRRRALRRAGRRVTAVQEAPESHWAEQQPFRDEVRRRARRPCAAQVRDAGGQRQAA